MHRSSESIGAIAAALAKAQAELSNPEKSLIGIIGPSTPREPGRVFRYAPLSSGLEIVRKSLGRHAIAISSPRQSTGRPASSGSTRCWPMPRENGWPRNGRYAALAIWPRRNAWVPR